VAFHAQQLAEKSFKALLSPRGLPFPHTHDLSLLAARLGAEAGIDPADPALIELSLLAVGPRYPDEPEPVDEDAARRAVETATAVCERMRRAIGC
jgi:HEPN domain-containing protein